MLNQINCINCQNIFISNAYYEWHRKYKCLKKPVESTTNLDTFIFTRQEMILPEKQWNELLKKRNFKSFNLPYYIKKQRRVIQNMPFLPTQIHCDSLKRKSIIINKPLKKQRTIIYLTPESDSDSDSDSVNDSHETNNKQNLSVIKKSGSDYGSDSDSDSDNDSDNDNDNDETLVIIEDFDFWESAETK